MTLGLCPMFVCELCACEREIEKANDERTCHTYLYIINYYIPECDGRSPVAPTFVILCACAAVGSGIISRCCILYVVRAACVRSIRLRKPTIIIQRKYDHESCPWPPRTHTHTHHSYYDAARRTAAESVYTLHCPLPYDSTAASINNIVGIYYIILLYNNIPL